MSCQRATLATPSHCNPSFLCGPRGHVRARRLRTNIANHHLPPPSPTCQRALSTLALFVSVRPCLPLFVSVRLFFYVAIKCCLQFKLDARALNDTC